MLCEFLVRCVIAYVDNILIYSPLRKVHVTQVGKVLKRLRQSHFFAKGEKCEFHATTVTLLGYIINMEGIAMDKEKLNTIRGWPTPNIVKKLQWFLRLKHTMVSASFETLVW